MPDDQARMPEAPALARDGPRTSSFVNSDIEGSCSIANDKSRGRTKRRLCAVCSLRNAATNRRVRSLPADPDQLREWCGLQSSHPSRPAQAERSTAGRSPRRARSRAAAGRCRRGAARTPPRPAGRSAWPTPSRTDCGGRLGLGNGAAQRHQQCQPEGQVRCSQAPCEGTPAALTRNSRYHPGGAIAAVAGSCRLT